MGYFLPSNVTTDVWVLLMTILAKNECKNKEDEVDICFEKKKTPTDICKFKLDKVSTNKCKKIALRRRKTSNGLQLDLGRLRLLLSKWTERDCYPCLFYLRAY